MLSSELEEESSGPALLPEEHSASSKLVETEVESVREHHTVQVEAPSLNVDTVPQKKLSKLQQLAKDKAAAKKASRVSAQPDSQSKLASSLARLRKQPVKVLKKPTNEPSRVN